MQQYTTDWNRTVYNQPGFIAFRERLHKALVREDVNVDKETEPMLIA